MPLYLEKLTVQELEALSRTQTVFMFPVAALEDHGPHLPLGTALFEAEQLCRIIAERIEIEMPGWVAILAPQAPLSIQSNTTAVALTVRPHVLRDWLVDSCTHLTRLGFKRFACVSGNYGPKQLTAIEEAGQLLKHRSGFKGIRRILKPGAEAPMLLSVSSAWLTRGEMWKSPFWPEPKEHAGKATTSIALKLFPDWVKPIWSSLPPAEKNPPGLIARGVLRWRRGLKGYWGHPSEASPEEGASILHDRVALVIPKLKSVWTGLSNGAEFRSRYGLIPTNRSFFLAWFLATLLAVLIGFWLYLALSSMMTA